MYQIKFWNCFVEGSNGGIHFMHSTRLDACQEAERLARQPQNKGKKVFVMEGGVYCLVPETPVEWHEA